MKLRKSPLLAAAVTLLVPALAHSQTPVAKGVEVGEPVTPISINVDLRNLPVAPQWKPGQPIREAAKRQYFPLTATKPHAPASKPTAADDLPQLQKIWDESPAAARASSLQRSGNRVSINNPNTGVSPGDPVVDVGTNHVIYGINASGGTAFTVYNKQGTKLAGPTTFKSLATSGSACATSVSDPIILFDRLANRWFMLEMGGSSSANYLCTYVSKTADPVSGGWYHYAFSTPALPDYPKCGVWNNAYVCTTNESGTGAKVYAFDREKMLTGATARPAQRFTTVAKLSGYGFQALTPATFMGKADKAPPSGSLQLLARHNDDEAHAGSGANGTQDFIDLYTMQIDWTTPANSKINTLPRIPISEFNSWLVDYKVFASVPQPGSTSKLDPIREVIMNSMVYRNMGTHEAIVGSFVTNQNPARTGSVVDAGVRWFELRRSGGGAWALHQEGTFSPGDSNTHHLMGSIAMDQTGNIGMSYNLTRTSTPTKYASLYYTGRKATDPLSTMTQGETEIAAGAAAETSGRWGDYHQTVVDPVDDCTFWTVGMYRPASSWQTRISDFKFDNCGTTNPGSYSISGKVTLQSGAALAGVTVSAAGKSATTTSTGEWSIGDLTNGSYAITPSLKDYTFNPASLNVTINGANVANQNFVGTPVSTGGDILVNGVPVNNISGTAGSERVWKLENVPANAAVTIASSGGTGDADLYVKFNAAPTSTSYDCRPYTGGNNETCNLTNAQAGTYYVMLRGYAQFDGVSLVGGYGGGGKVFENTNDYTIADRATVDSPITVSGLSGNAPAALRVTTNILHTYIGDLKVDLVAPDGTLYNLHNRAGGSADNIVRTFTVDASSEAANGEWKLRVNDAALGDTGKIDSWKLEF